MNNNNYHYTNVTINNNPHAYKNRCQILDEIDMLKEKIKNNMKKIDSVSTENKLEIENIIAEDKIKLYDLEYELLRRDAQKESDKALAIIITVILALTIFILFIFIKFR